jgi:tetratricopeptide (TPR) repeat protein
MLAESLLGRVGEVLAGGARLFDLGEKLLRARGLGRLLGSPDSIPGVRDFEALTRRAEPGRPSLRGLPVGPRDRALLLRALAARLDELAAACQARGCRFVIALSLHGMDGASPWCSELEPGPNELEDYLATVLRQPVVSKLPKIEQLLAERPERADLHYARAKLLRLGGREAEAREEFLRALDLDLAPLHQTSQVRQVLREAAERSGVPFLDLNAALADASGVTGPDYFLDYAHADLAGHRKLALYLAGTLQGNLLPALPAGFEAAFESGMTRLQQLVVKESIELARGRMSSNLGRYYLAFGNFRDALPHLELATRELAREGKSNAGEVLEFCREKLAQVRR